MHLEINHTEALPAFMGAVGKPSFSLSITIRRVVSKDKLKKLSYKSKQRSLSPSSSSSSRRLIDLYNEIRPESTSKSVRFADTEPEIIGDSSKAIGGNPRKLFYSKTEYKQMRIREAQLMAELEHAFPTCKFAIDGVESLEYRVAKMGRIQRARACVLKLQRLPDQEFVELYCKTSRLSSKVARDKGVYTEKEVKKQWSNDGTSSCNQVIFESFSEDDDSESTVGASFFSE
jgi:hypothetical protein